MRVRARVKARVRVRVRTCASEGECATSESIPRVSDWSSRTVGGHGTWARHVGMAGRLRKGQEQTESGCGDVERMAARRQARREGGGRADL